jgi:alcohol dehydrogenase class IV
VSNYFNPVKVIKTDNWLFELKKNIEELKITKPFIVTSQGNRKRLVLNSIFNSKSIYSYVGSNPTFDDCNDIINYCKDQSFNGVIAIGGGSPMDLAKVALAHISLGKTDVYQLIDYKNNYPITIPSIFIPTTHGTGSEVTMWGTIWNMKKKKKYSISHIDLYPNVAILDGNLTISLPLDISIITTMDALSHSFEALWNINANDISTTYAIEAISLILENVEKLKKDPNNLTIKNNLLLASTKAGLAFSNTKTAAAHAISYPLTIIYGVPHGIAAYFSLHSLLEINKNSINGPLSKICKYNNITYHQLKNIIRTIPKGIFQMKLNKWGVKQKHISTIVNETLNSRRIENNIVTLSKKNVENIVSKAL